MAPVAYQPLAQHAMDSTEKLPLTPEQERCRCENEQQQLEPLECTHKRQCHARRRRRIMLFSFSFALFLVAVVGIFYAKGCPMTWLFGGGDDGSMLGGLWKRAVDNSTGQNDFTHHKLYLIVIFVGLFVCLVLGVMLAAWCCRGSFENPLCCPCYLCACCGGLACLECISCGLCAEGIEQF